jgi:hypothetical protein
MFISSIIKINTLSAKAFICFYRRYKHYLIHIVSIRYKHTISAKWGSIPLSGKYANIIITCLIQIGYSPLSEMHTISRSKLLYVYICVRECVRAVVWCYHMSYVLGYMFQVTCMRSATVVEPWRNPSARNVRRRSGALDTDCATTTPRWRRRTSLAETIRDRGIKPFGLKYCLTCTVHDRDDKSFADILCVSLIEGSN